MSKIEVDQITQQSGTTVTVGGGACKTAVVDATTVTLGRSGGSVSLASGATQSGFGRTGAVNWQTTKKTANFTATSGEGYFCDTAASGAFTLTLPSSPSAGDIVGLKDYNGNFAAANLTIGRGGSNLSGTGADKVLDTDHLSLTLVYVDATEGWVPVEEGTGFIGEGFISATGGTITTSGNDKIHTFTGPGTFSVSALAETAANNQVSYMVVAGGGSGGAAHGGGGGAGGFREDKSPVTPYTASPLEGAGTINVTVTDFPITVGGGGAQQPSNTGTGNPGNNSVFSTITSAGGGGGGGESPSPGSNRAGAPGGSGGGRGSAGPASAIGNGNTPPVSPPQGNNGGQNDHNPPGYGSGGGGGATAVGTAATTTQGGPGGAGATTSINGTPTTYAGGGGGSAYNANPAGSGGAGGGGNGTSHNSSNGTAGTANTGGGGGGGERCVPNTVGFAGGSGIVIIRYKYQ